MRVSHKTVTADEKTNKSHLRKTFIGRIESNGRNSTTVRARAHIQHSKTIEVVNNNVYDTRVYFFFLVYFYLILRNEKPEEYGKNSPKHHFIVLVSHFLV